MSETIQKEPVVPSPVGENDVQDETTKDVVAYDTYQKVLSEKKKTFEMNKKLQDELSSLRSQLEEINSTKEIGDDPSKAIGVLKRRLDEREKAVKELNQKYAFSSARRSIEVEASKLGCTDLELLFKSVDLADVYVDKDTFEPDPESLRASLEEVKRKHPLLFMRKPNVQDVNVKHQAVNLDRSVDLKSMTRDELLDFVKKNGKSIK